MRILTTLLFAFLSNLTLVAETGDVPKAKLEAFRTRVEPVLKRVCFGCHGPKKQKGKLRIDALDPDLLKGKDVSWWLGCST